MQNKRLQKTIFAALLLAITVVLGRIFLIPIPMTRGNINLCDAPILLASMLLGPISGLVVGGFGGLLLDLISGYSQYMIFSFISHGLEGFLAGWIIKRSGKKKIALLVGVVIMVIGYFFADWILSKSIITGFWSIGTNLLQGIVGAVVAWIVDKPLEKRIHF
ncbi:ECF transporter S component [Limosilactobacillus sp.]|uniref:ECF transporter S component n=1 Tax=Limosilactobacillus sp. TaxID=2773925 RepID=UPI00345E3ECE